MTSVTTPTEATTADPRRWKALVVIAIAQLMVVLDASIVNIALPSIQIDLGFTDANRQWVITAYTLAFGGLLLLGGRIADYSGRKRVFIIGLAGFAFASFLGGISTSEISATGKAMTDARSSSSSSAATGAADAAGAAAGAFTSGTGRAVTAAATGAAAKAGVASASPSRRLRVVSLAATKAAHAWRQSVSLRLSTWHHRVKER